MISAPAVSGNVYKLLAVAIQENDYYTHPYCRYIVLGLGIFSDSRMALFGKIA